MTNFEPDFINFWESQNLKIVWGLRPSTPHTKHWNSEQVKLAKLKQKEGIPGFEPGTC